MAAQLSDRVTFASARSRARMTCHFAPNLISKTCAPAAASHPPPAVAIELGRGEAAPPTPPPRAAAITRPPWSPGLLLARALARAQSGRARVSWLAPIAAGAARAHDGNRLAPCAPADRASGLPWATQLPTAWAVASALWLGRGAPPTQHRHAGAARRAPGTLR